MLVDYSSSVHYLLALAPEIILAIWGTAVLIRGVGRKQEERAGARAGVAFGRWSGGQRR